MSGLSERQIISILQKKFSKKIFVPEDVESFSLDKNQFVIAIDTLVDSTDIPPKTPIDNFVRKSVVACVSDFASKGVKPRYGLVSLTIPRRYTKKQIKKIANILAKTSKEFDFSFLGGDTNEGKELVIQIVLVGFTKHIVKRKGAKIGDRIFTTGPFGLSSAGLKIIMDKKKARSSFAEKAKNSFYRPLVPLKFTLRSAKLFSSAMDSSDGLAITLNEMARQSKKRFIINSIPTNDDVSKFCKQNKLDPLDLVFRGGEEYEVVFTSGKPRLIQKSAKSLKVRLLEIGYVSRGKGVFYEKDGRQIRIPDKGWIHFT